MPADPAALAFDALRRAQVEFVVVGMSGINAYAPDPRDAFVTRDIDCLLRPGATIQATHSDAMPLDLMLAIAGRPKDLEFLRLFAARFRGRSDRE